MINRIQIFVGFDYRERAATNVLISLIDKSVGDTKKNAEEMLEKLK